MCIKFKWFFVFISFYGYVEFVNIVKSLGCMQSLFFLRVECVELDGDYIFLLIIFEDIYCDYVFSILGVYYSVVIIRLYLLLIVLYVFNVFVFCFLFINFVKILNQLYKIVIVYLYDLVREY